MPILMFGLILCRVTCVSWIDELIDVLVVPMFAAKNFITSLADERKAPAPESVGISQLIAGKERHNEETEMIP